MLFLVKPIGKDAIWVIFEWSGTYHGPKRPQHYSGRDARVYVRDGDGWRVRMEIWNSGSPS